ncbi:MAG: hypothetical protein CVV25_03520 [Ignavibacteriae bacterium HGW-Ignavibacteriae-4]|jgi:hypothetical protein|nr:MAG: hypothetical protein CVV25_03520 [Ignavibacteriae bacterium HGW-Ignavibacteriae-4]
MKLINSAILFSILFFSFLFVGCDNSDSVTPSENHFEAAGYIIKNEADSTVFKVLKGQVDNLIAESFTLMFADGSQIYSIEFLDENGDNISVPDEEHTLLFEMEDNTFANFNITEWMININLLKVGKTNFRIQILHEGHPDFTSPYVPMEIK